MTRPSRDESLRRATVVRDDGARDVVGVRPTA